MLGVNQMSTKEFSWPDLTGNQRQAFLSCVEDICEDFDAAEAAVTLIEHTSDEWQANALVLAVVRALGGLEVLVTSAAAHCRDLGLAAYDPAEGRAAEQVTSGG